MLADLGNYRAPFSCLPSAVGVQMEFCQFNKNEDPAEVYASDVSQGVAVVATNTGISDVNSCA